MSGRLAPPSDADGEAVGGAAGARGGVVERAPLGMNGGAAGVVKACDAGGVKGDTGGEGVNSAIPVEGEGGVAVAAADARSTDSGLGLGAAGISALGGVGGWGAEGRCTDGTAEAR
ncbi:MAG TPA: hypothetical protein VK478_11910 [Gemmatimonadaceae bacterium]|nr:hypothetical protein [Gemmatimonadaceae bacterium]